MIQTLRYLNGILTVLALLLALNLWTAWASPDVPSATNEAHARGIPDAGAQRQEIISLLKQLNQRSDDMNALLRSGDVRARVILPDSNH